MAKKRLKLKDKQGNVIDYDISAASVTIDAEGKSVQVKIAELVEAIAEAVKTVVYNGEQHIVNNGRVDIGNQMQSDWSESSQSYPTFIKNKPNVVTGIKVGASGSTITPTNGVVTLPEISSQPECDTAMSSTSEAPVQNKVIKAYVDNLINGLINGAPQALDTLKELADALSDNDDAVAALTTLIDTKQNTLVSGTNIKTVNNQSILGSGDISVSGGESVVINTDGANIVDSHTNNSVLLAPSARQMKIMYDNVAAIFNALAPMAFTNGKPQLDWSGSVSNYSIGLAAADSHITLTLTDGSGNSLTSPVAEGSEVNIVISVDTGYRFAAAPTATMNGESLTVTQSGSTYVIQVSAIAGNVVITAASQQVGTYSVTKPSNTILLDSNGNEVSSLNVTEGDSWSGKIKPASGYGWTTPPTAAMSGNGSVTIGSVTNTNEYPITITNASGNITITATVEVVGQITLNKVEKYCTISGTPVLEGQTQQVTITPNDGFGIQAGNVIVKKDGTDITSQCTISYGAIGAASLETGKNNYVTPTVAATTVSIPNASGTIEVTCKAAVILQKDAYVSGNSSASTTKGRVTKEVNGIGGTNPYPCGTYGFLDFATTGDEITETSVIVWSHKLQGANADRYISLMLFDTTGTSEKFISNGDSTNGVRTYNCSSFNPIPTGRYIRATFNYTDLSDCFVKYYPTGMSGDEIVVFDGSDSTSYILLEPVS